MVFGISLLLARAIWSTCAEGPYAEGQDNILSALPNMMRNPTGETHVLESWRSDAGERDRH